MGEGKGERRGRGGGWGGGGSLYVSEFEVFLIFFICDVLRLIIIWRIYDVL